jgi:hypothetical protein
MPHSGLIIHGVHFQSQEHGGGDFAVRCCACLALVMNVVTLGIYGFGSSVLIKYANIIMRQRSNLARIGSASGDINK